MSKMEIYNDTKVDRTYFDVCEGNLPVNDGILNLYAYRYSSYNYSICKVDNFKSYDDGATTYLSIQWGLRAYRSFTDKGLV